MNAPHSPSPLASLELAPGDPILGVTEAFVADRNPNKVNLGVGVYLDDNGKVPLLDCVREVESERSASGRPWPYLPIDGLAAYDKAVQALVFGADSSALKEGRIVTVQAGGLTVASVYVPNGGKDFPAKMQFLEALERFAAEHQAAGSSLLICGDLNIARTEMDVHPKERKPRAIGQLPEERALLERIIGHGLVDVGRALEPDNDQMFTWWAPWRDMRKRNIGWRLDYVLASRALFDRVQGSTVQREFGTSDHAPVTAEFA